MNSYVGVISDKSKRFERPISNLEKIFQIREKKDPNVAINIVLEGIGDISKEQLQKAVNEACEANPGSRLIEKNHVWVDSGKNPTVQQIDLSDSNYKTLEDHPLFQKTVSSENGPKIQVYVGKGSPTRLIFRFPHSIMDGHGSHSWIHDVFRSLRGEPLKGTTSKMTDDEVLKTFNEKKYQHSNFDSHSPLGKAVSGKIVTSDVEYRRIQVPCGGTALTARILKVLSDEDYKHGNLVTKAFIPVDLRHRISDIRSTANLTSGISVSTEHDTSWQDIQKSIVKGLLEKDDLANVPYASLVRVFPRKVINYFMDKTLKSSISHDRYLASAILSDIGKVDLNLFSCNSFITKNVFNASKFLLPLAPVKIVSVVNSDHVELAIAMPRVLAKNGAMDRLASALTNGLMANDPHTNVSESIDKNELNQKETQKIPYEFDLIKDQGHGEMHEEYYSYTMHQLFSKTAAKYPDSTALEMDGKKITYRELDEKSNQLAHTLREKGIKPNTTIAIVAERSPEVITAILGVLKSGAAYVPIDVRYPPERQSYILKDADVKLVLTQPNKFTGDAGERQVLNISDPKVYNSKKEPAYNVNTPNDLAYILYTSGSTGKPKGVAMEHKTIVNQDLWAKRVFNADKNTIAPFFTSISFTLTQLSIFLPITSGGSLVIFGDDKYNTNISKIVNNPRINFIKLTPRHLKMMNELNLDRCGFKNIMSAGEALPTKLAKSIFFKLHGKSNIYNSYGQSEAIPVMFHKFNPDKDKGITVPIGKPVDNTHVYILKKDGTPAKIGEPGEICVSGSCVSRGYLNRPELNKTSYTENPFIQGERMLHTGDYACWNSPNELTFSFREDDEINLNGFRITPGEVQSTLKEYSEIKEVAVLPKDLEGKRVLAAYFTSDSKLELEKIHSFLSKKLPHYMIPSSFIQMESLPTNFNGKLDRGALPSPVKYIAPRNNNDKPSIESSNNITRKLAGIWSDILEVDKNQIFNDSRFAQLGGDSLNMIQMIGRIEKEILTQKQAEEFISQLNKVIEKPTIKDISNTISSVIIKINDKKKDIQLSM